MRNLLLKYVNTTTELIDTCWDVNVFIYVVTVTKWVRINRYMLGCKYGLCDGFYAMNNELIDTCWDVNDNAKKGVECTPLN